MELIYNNTYYKFENHSLLEDDESQINADAEKIISTYNDAKNKEDSDLYKFAELMAKKLDVSINKSDDSSTNDSSTNTIDSELLAKYIETISNITQSLSQVKI